MGGKNKLSSNCIGPTEMPKKSNGSSPVAVPARKLFFVAGSIARNSGRTEAAKASAKSQRHNNATLPKNPALKQRWTDLTRAIIQSAESASARAAIQVLAQ